MIQNEPLTTERVGGVGRTAERAPSRKVLLGAAGAIAGAMLVLLLPAPEGLRPEAQRTAAVFVMAVILWATEALPVGVTSLLALLLQPLFQVRDLRTALTSFISPVFFFVLTMFCLAAALINAGLDRRFALRLLDHAGTDSRRVVRALMFGTASISTILSDVPACAIFMAIALGVLTKMGATPAVSQLGKALMIGIPIAALIGGVATPAGSSVNILGIHFIEQYGKVRVPFLSWMAICVPMVLVLMPIAVWVVLRCFPPEVATIAEVSDLRRERAALGPLCASEKKMIGLFCTMIVLWMLGSWIEQLDVVLVALAGTIVMFLPGVQLLTWKQAERAIAWDTLLMIGGVTSLGAASVDSGLAKYLVDASFGGTAAWPTVGLVALISTFTVVIHLALPIGPVVNAVVIPPIVILALGAGQNPALYALPVAFTASCAFLLPLDAVALVTYSRGYYRMFDMLLPGTIISLAWVIWMTALTIGLLPLLGLV